MLPSVGPLEIIIVLAIALLLFGPRRIPEVGRSVGRGIRELKSGLTDDADSEPDD